MHGSGKLPVRSCCVRLVVSEESMSSDWVKREIRKALLKEKETGHRVLFPIRLVPYERIRSWDWLNDKDENIASEVWEYFIPDFTIWKNHDSFKVAFDRLLQDLNAKDETKPD